MNEDRTESDWQGLVSEVRPRRRPGGMGPRPQPPVPAPGRRARQGSAGDGRAEAGALRLRPPPSSARCAVAPALPGLPGRHFLPRQLVPAFGEGLPSGREWQDCRETRGDPGGGARPHLPSRPLLFWRQAIGCPVLKRKGGARGKSGP